MAQAVAHFIGNEEVGGSSPLVSSHLKPLYIKGFFHIMKKNDDADDLYEILGADQTMANCEPAYDFEKTEQFLSSFCIGRNGAVAAVHKESGKMIGYILFNETGECVYEIGWFFNRRFWRQGYAYESCKAVIDYAFTEMKAHKVFAETTDAVKSVGLMKKLGMTLEGIQRSHTKDTHGQWADLYLCGLVNPKA